MVLHSCFSSPVGTGRVASARSVVRLFHVRFMCAWWFRYQFIPVATDNWLLPLMQGLPFCDVIMNTSLPSLARAASITISNLSAAPLPPMRLSSAAIACCGVASGACAFTVFAVKSVTRSNRTVKIRFFIIGALIYWHNFTV